MATEADLPDARPRLFKDRLGAPAVSQLGAAVAAAYPAFDRSAFEREATTGLDGLELTPRVAHIGAALRAHLPVPFPEVAAILMRVAETWPGVDPGTTPSDFAAWPLFHVVPAAGLDHLDLGLEALRRLTPLFSAEGAIRPFLDRYGDVALAILTRWTADPDEHVRRLVSEGTRPRLPWATRVRRFVEDPRPGLALLDRLVDDPSLYVSRSVANHLNDVSRDHPDLAVATAARWMSAPTPHRRWVAKHALRTLVKVGRPDVFALLGHGGGAPCVEALLLQVEPAQVPWGGAVAVSARLKAVGDAPESWVVDWAVGFMSARGQTRRKVFKGLQLRVLPGQEEPFRASYRFREITTRRHYPGTHRIEVLVNGTCVAAATFELLPP